MKTKIITSVNRYMIIAFLLLSWTSGLYSQQIVKYKDGNWIKVKIVRQTKDTLEYQLPSESDITRIVSMNQIDNIINLEKDKTYVHYRHANNTGIVLASAGAAISIVGVVIMGSAKHTNDEFWGDSYNAAVGAGAAVTCIGGALLLTGAILAATTSAKIKNYENKLKGFSFDLKYTPELKGISLSYRF
jgi:hypothetical protein